MSHQLDFIAKQHILQGIADIELNGVPRDNEWNEYWIVYNGKYYPFKYTVEKASNYTDNAITTTSFQSNDSNRKKIASLGFIIAYRAQLQGDFIPNFFIGASYYGPYSNHVNMFDDFMLKSYWATDHDLTHGEGYQIFQKLKKVKINDRIAIRYLSRKNNTIDIAAVGTIRSVDEIEDGRLNVTWDYNPYLYKGEKPAGNGAGNWWKTLIQLERPEDIYLIFGYAASTKRAARLTYNSIGYIAPSGPAGKSNDKNSHEGKYGYGHEEWLFDTGKLIDGYHYGFLEPVRKHQLAYTGKTYDVWLYTINANTKVRYWIGEIKNVEVIDAEEAARIKTFYENQGWLEEMQDQIKANGANEDGFSDYKGLDIFNVRYVPENIKLNDPYVELSPDHPLEQVNRYSFLFMKETFAIPDVKLETPFVFLPPSTLTDPESKLPKKTKSARPPRQVEITYLHKAISEHLTKRLRRDYEPHYVTPEHPAGYGQNRIDIVVNDDGDLIFYEIKTYNSLMTSIREAVGQLMEYAMWHSHLRAKKLIVISQSKASDEAKKYFAHLRQNFNLPIYYQSYDYQLDVLSEEF